MSCVYILKLKIEKFRCSVQFFKVLKSNPEGHYNMTITHPLGKGPSTYCLPASVSLPGHLVHRQRPEDTPVSREPPSLMATWLTFSSPIQNQFFPGVTQATTTRISFSVGSTATIPFVWWAEFSESKRQCAPGGWQPPGQAPALGNDRSHPFSCCKDGFSSESNRFCTFQSLAKKQESIYLM